MKKSLLIALLYLTTNLIANGQGKDQTGNTSVNIVSPVQATYGLFIQNGASLSSTNNASISIHNSNLSNNGTLSDASGTIYISGNTVTNLEGSGQTTLHHVEINKSLNEVTINQNLEVGGDFTLTSGGVFLQTGNIDFGSTGKIVNETEANRIFGEGGHLKSTVNLNAPTNQNPGNLGAIISSVANLGSTEIIRRHAAISIFPFNSGIAKTFEITPTNNSGLNANLKLHFFESELNTNLETNLFGWKSNNAGSTWEKQASSIDTINNYVQLFSQNSLGLYTAHVDCPTIAISTNSPLCEGENLNLSVNINDENAEYYWDGPNFFRTTLRNPNITAITPVESGEYSLSIVQNGCTVSTTANVIVYPLPEIPTIAADNQTICKGGSVVLTGNCPIVNARFRWETPNFLGNLVLTDPEVTPDVTRTITEPGTYRGLCESQEGCLSAFVSITITEDVNCNGQNFISITPEKPAICPGSSITMTATGCSGTLTWLGGPSSQSGSSVSLSPTATTTYLVQCNSGGSGTFDVVVASNTLAVSSNVATGKERFKAVTTLTSAKKVGDPNFTPGANVIYEAGNSITLLPGFQAEKWSTFKAEIKTCL